METGSGAKRGDLTQFYRAFLCTWLFASVDHEARRFDQHHDIHDILAHQLRYGMMSLPCSTLVSPRRMIEALIFKCTDWDWG